MKSLKVGDKIKGFKFSTGEAALTFNPDMNRFIGYEGVVSRIFDDFVLISYFKPYERCWTYPLDHPLAKKISKVKNKLK